MKKTLKLILALALAFSAFTASAQEYTVISSLDSKSKDANFKQHQSDFQKNNMAVISRRPYEMKFYEYTVTESQFRDVHNLSSRTSLRYDTIVTLNGIDSTEENLSGRTIYIPTVNGLFIPVKPVTSIDILLSKEYPLENEAGEKQYPVYTVGGKDFYFIVDGKFSPTERAFFFEPGMTLPLEKSVLTSPFGMRISPISGKWLMHKGIDMAAPTGTQIHACKAGKVVSAIAMDYTYGNYVILDHGKGMTSLYAHMSKMLVSKGDYVSAGQVIGLVGQTGLATGPHLHFEIKLNGELQDPQKYINVK
ncbi:MAG: M23 family metallopeptidase [Treponema sp.]|nr:M23 family metallopeptidase [Treponema sp.]MBQ5384771.1 M23 family metallopeptidase [Treponema sp.]